MQRALLRVQQCVDALLGLGGPRLPPLAPAYAAAAPVPTFNNRPGSEYGIAEIMNDMRTLLGVPKYRTSKPKKTTRKFSYTRLLSLNTNLVTCQSCGAYHEADTICGKCYDKVRQVTNQIKQKMMAYNPYKGERQDKEVHVKFTDDVLEDGVVNGKRVLEMETERPSWFKKFFVK